jgi:predicted TIM-barrel fold metal-dependent hydrolase
METAVIDLRPLALFDANCMLGTIGEGCLVAFGKPEQLEAELATLGIREALVFSSLAKLNDPELGNGLLLEALAGRNRLHPCLTLTPELELDEDSLERLQALLKSGTVRACRVFPKANGWELAPWIMPEILSALARARIPLLVDQDTVHWDDPFDWSQLERLCREHRELPVIVVRQSLLAARNLFPLFRTCDNLYLETSYFQRAGGLEEVSRKFGTSRLLFGSGLPVFDPRLPLAGLFFSALTEREKEAVAGGNLRALLAAVEPSRL